MKIDYRWVQSRLVALGFNPGPIDGVRGPRTDAAVVAFKRSIGFQARPYIGPLTLAALGFKSDVQDGSLTIAERPPWIVIAERVLGLHEVRDNSFLRRWLGSDGHALGDPAKYPWCGDFVETCIRLALPDEPFPGPLGQNPYWARNWSYLGDQIRPTLGAVMCWPRGSGGHVAFLIGQDRRDYYVIGGNQSNTVSRTRISKRREIVGCRWPSTYPQSPINLPVMTPGDLTRSTNEA